MYINAIAQVPFCRKFPNFPASKGTWMKKVISLFYSFLGVLVFLFFFVGSFG